MTRGCQGNGRRVSSPPSSRCCTSPISKESFQIVAELAVATIADLHHMILEAAPQLDSQFPSILIYCQPTHGKHRTRNNHFRPDEGMSSIPSFKLKSASCATCSRHSSKALMAACRFSANALLVESKCFKLSCLDLAKVKRSRRLAPNDSISDIRCIFEGYGYSSLEFRLPIFKCCIEPHFH